jgi:hypothetical protein
VRQQSDSACFVSDGLRVGLLGQPARSEVEKGILHGSWHVQAHVEPAGDDL